MEQETIAKPRLEVSSSIIGNAEGVAFLKAALPTFEITIFGDTEEVSKAIQLLTDNGLEEDSIGAIEFLETGSPAPAIRLGKENFAFNGVFPDPKTLKAFASYDLRDPEESKGRPRGGTPLLQANLLSRAKGGKEPTGPTMKEFKRAFKVWLCRQVRFRVESEGVDLLVYGFTFRGLTYMINSPAFPIPMWLEKTDKEKVLLVLGAWTPATALWAFPSDIRIEAIEQGPMASYGHETIARKRRRAQATS